MADQPSSEISALNAATIRAHEEQMKKLKILLAKVGKVKNTCRRERKLLEQVIIDLRKEVRISQGLVNRMNRLLRTANVPVMGVVGVKLNKVILRKINVVKGV